MDEKGTMRMSLEQGNKEVILGGVSIIGIIAGWIAAGVRMSAREGRKEERLEAAEKTIARYDGDINMLRIHHDEDMSSVRAFFNTEKGGQKFMTFPDHDHICARNGKSTSQEVAHLAEVIRDNTIQVGTMSEHVRALQVAVAVLQTEKNRRDR
jgi:hypothetical protein